MIRWLAGIATTPRGVRSGRVVCAVGALVAVAAGAVAGAYFAGRPSFGAWLALGSFVAAVSVGAVVAQVFYDADGLFEQRGRDLRAQRLWATLDAGAPPPEPFVLYLRPFASTDEIDAVVHNIGAVSGGGTPQLAISADRVEFEEQIEKALRPIGLMVGLGRPLEHIGAGRIVVGDEIWKRAIETMMDHAELIVLLPSAQGGTIWEVGELLTSGRMVKTIVADPPNGKGARRRDYDHAAEWENIQAAFAGHGYELPDDNSDGMLIYFGAETTPQAFTRLSLDGDTDVRRFAKRVVRLGRATNSEANPSEELSHA